jgi:beta-glucanase (GH16 family)
MRARSANVAVGVLLAAAGPCHGSWQVVFDEQFDEDGLIDESRWTTPIWASECSPAWIPRTALRNWLQEYGQSELLVEGGDAILTLQTFNPYAPVDDPSFYGTEIDTIQSFAVGGGVAMEARVWIDPALPRGAVMSLFGYRREGTCEGGYLTSEIDLEVLSNLYLEIPPAGVHTNVYVDEPPGAGHPEIVPCAATFPGAYNTLRIEWYPGRIRWLVNGVPVFERTDLVPAGALEVRLNIWAPDTSFDAAYDAGFQPVDTPEQNTVYEYRVDYVVVERWTCPADLNVDGIVGVGDFLALLGAWGPCPDEPAPCPGDLDGDDMVGVTDFLALLGAWGPCEPASARPARAVRNGRSDLRGTDPSPPAAAGSR